VLVVVEETLVVKVVVDGPPPETRLRFFANAVISLSPMERRVLKLVT
jgi:hypothetical protein